LIKVSIVGGSGYTGAELIRILLQHPDAEILHVTSRELEGRPVSARLPNAVGIDLSYERPDPSRLSDSDVVFCCVHHTASMRIVPSLLESSKVIDLSADYRFSDKRIYEEAYGVAHSSPDIEAVYGLPEIHREEIRAARLVANPGCYPTGAILALAPLVSEGLIDLDRIVIDSKSGSSGAGIKPSPFTHHPETSSFVKPYKVTTHRHAPEVDQELSRLAGRRVTVNFTPHLVPISRGILTTCHTFPSSRLELDEVSALYSEFYADSPFVRIMEVVPDLRGVAGSNRCDIGFERDERTGRLVVVSAIDNLTKGASGQAVQNMNLMFGRPEGEGLTFPGLYP